MKTYEDRKEWYREYYQKKKEYIRKVHSEYRRKHIPEQSAYYLENKEKLNNYRHEYYKKNKTNNDLQSKQIKNRFGVSANQVRKYGFKLVLEIYDRYSRECSVCGDVNYLQIHHIDGSGKAEHPNDNLENLQLICRRCHGSIHGKQGKGIKKTKGTE